MSLRLALLCAALVSAGAPALAQHGQHGSAPQGGHGRVAPQGGHSGLAPQGGHGGLAPQGGHSGLVPQQGHGGSAQPASPYAGQQSRDIKALSEKEVQDLLAGAGMGLAKTAELNRYPGPTHALEHADRLELSSAQREAITVIVLRHKAEARRLGARVVELERELDALFASGKATAAAVDRLAAALGEANGRLRAEHLKTHLETTAVLNAVQVARYVEVRGY